MLYVIAKALIDILASIKMMIASDTVAVNAQASKTKQTERVQFVTATSLTVINLPRGDCKGFRQCRQRRSEAGASQQRWETFFGRSATIKNSTAN